MINGALVQFGCYVNECEGLHLHAYQAKPEPSCTPASTNCLYTNHMDLNVATIPAKADVGMVVQKYENKDSNLTSLILVGSFGGTQFSLLLWLISKPQTLMLWV